MRHPIRHIVAAAFALLVLAPGAACARPTGGRELILFEAASLKDAFAKLFPYFEKDEPGSCRYQ